MSLDIAQKSARHGKARRAVAPYPQKPEQTCIEGLAHVMRLVFCIKQRRAKVNWDMRNKRYTNTTFTKRVDHEAGRHRTRRSLPEPMVCEGCGATFSHRRWTRKSDLKADRSATKHTAKSTLCPACKQERAGVPSGFVYVKGKFSIKHRNEIGRLLRNEAERVAQDNPLARIMGWEDTDDQLVVKTTTEHLAQRLGHALEKAFHGEVRYDFSHENKLARVYWERKF